MGSNQRTDSPPIHLLPFISLDDIHSSLEFVNNLHVRKCFTDNAFDVSIPWVLNSSPQFSHLSSNLCQIQQLTLGQGPNLPLMLLHHPRSGSLL